MYLNLMIRVKWIVPSNENEDRINKDNSWLVVVVEWFHFHKINYGLFYRLWIQEQIDQLYSMALTADEFSEKEELFFLIAHYLKALEEYVW